MAVRNIMRTLALLIVIALAALLGAPAALAVEPAEAEALADRAEAGSAEAVAALISLLHDSNSKVRYHAEWGLARTGAAAVPGLIQALASREKDAERASVARILGRMGPVAAPAIPGLRAALASPDSSTAGAASYALGHLRAREATEELTFAYAAARKIPNQKKMARALRDIGADQGARTARANLVASVSRDLADSDPETRNATVTYTWALYRAVAKDNVDDFPMRDELSELVPGLVAALEAARVEEDLKIAEQALKSLALAGRSASEAIPALERLIDHPRLHHSAMAALVALGSGKAERIVADKKARALLDKRIRSGFSVQNHQGHTELTLFRVAGAAKDGLQMSVRFLYAGREPRTPTRVVFYLISTSMEPRFADAKVTWFADGARVPMPGLDRSVSQSQIGGVIEYVSATMPMPRFLTLANARTLGANAAGVEFRLAPQDLAALHHFAGKLPAIASPR
jgi:HEAT repeat protein